MREGDKVGFYLRVRLNDMTLHQFLEENFDSVESDPLFDKNGKIVTVIGLLENFPIDSLAEFIFREKVAVEEIDFYCDIFSGYDEGILEIPSWFLVMNSKVGFPEMSFSYTVCP